MGGSSRGSQVLDRPSVANLRGRLSEVLIMCSSLQYFVAASSVYSLAFFQPIILRQGMGFSYTKAQLLSSPPYIFTVFASLATSWLSDKIRLRWPILVGQSVIAIIGLLLVLCPKPPAVRYFGLFLAT